MPRNKQERIRESLKRHLDKSGFLNKKCEVRLIKIKEGVIITFSSRKNKGLIDLLEGDETFTLVHVQIRSKIGYIENLVVNESQRRTGIGTRLYGAFEDFLKEQECREIRTIPNRDGIRFWPKMGFVYMGKIDEENTIYYNKRL